MKVLLTSSGTTLDAALDPRFGRAAYFVVVDTESREVDAIDNVSRHATGGAGIAAAQAAIDAGVGTLVTGQLGPNALNVLHASKIDLFQGVQGTLRDNLEQLKAKKLKLLTLSGPSHYGMSGGQGFGHHGGRP